MTPEPSTDIVDDLMAYEEGSLDYDGCLDLFSDLIRTGMYLDLQGHYGRTVEALIENEMVQWDGEVTAPLYTPREDR